MQSFHLVALLLDLTNVLSGPGYRRARAIEDERKSGWESAFGNVSRSTMRHNKRTGVNTADTQTQFTKKNEQKVKDLWELGVREATIRRYQLMQPLDVQHLTLKGHIEVLGRHTFGQLTPRVMRALILNSPWCWRVAKARLFLRICRHIKFVGIPQGQCWMCENVTTESFCLHLTKYFTFSPDQLLGLQREVEMQWSLWENGPHAPLIQISILVSCPAELNQVCFRVATL